MEMSSKASTTTNSSDGAGTHHSRDSVPRSQSQSISAYAARPAHSGSFDEFYNCLKFSYILK